MVFGDPAFISGRRSRNSEREDPFSPFVATFLKSGLVHRPRDIKTAKIILSHVLSLLGVRVVGKLPPLQVSYGFLRLVAFFSALSLVKTTKHTRKKRGTAR